MLPSVCLKSTGRDSTNAASPFRIEGKVTIFVGLDFSSNHTLIGLLFYLLSLGDQRRLDLTEALSLKFSTTNPLLFTVTTIHDATFYTITDSMSRLDRGIDRVFREEGLDSPPYIT